MLLQFQVLGTGDPSLVSRVHLFGLERDDIVDYLPVASFPKASALGDNWTSVRQAYRKLNTGGVSGEKFKADLGITEDAVRRAIAGNLDHVDPELARLLGLIRRLVDDQA